jgi:hypothetical protein
VAKYVGEIVWDQILKFLNGRMRILTFLWEPVSNYGRFLSMMLSGGALRILSRK